MAGMNCLFARFLSDGSYFFLILGWTPNQYLEEIAAIDSIAVLLLPTAKQIVIVQTPLQSKTNRLRRSIARDFAPERVELSTRRE